MNEIVLNIINIVGDSFCVEVEDGQRVFEVVKKAIDENRKVKISFKNVEILTSAFLNMAIGQLYGNYDEDIIRGKLSVIEINQEDKNLLKRVVDTAKIYYKNLEKMKESIKKILDE